MAQEVFDKSMYEVHHIGYLVKNIQKSIKTFSLLGYSVEKKSFFDEIRNADIAFMTQNGEARVELVEPKKESDIYPLLKKYANSPYHICYKVKNLASAVSEIRGGWFPRV